VAVAFADQHLLEKKRKEVEEKAAEWRQKAELAIDKNKDDLARAALERSVSHQKMAESFKQQEADQKAQAEQLKSSLKTLGEKLAEAQTKRDLFMAQHRRARTLHRVGDDPIIGRDQSQGASLGRVESGVPRSEAMSRVRAELVPDDVEEKFASLEKEDQINRLLAEIKARRNPKA
jgi:phage shock protein A